MIPIIKYYFDPINKDSKKPVAVYPLIKECIDSIPDEFMHGNYRIGLISSIDERFIVKYIGRGDNGLKERISDHLTDFIKDELLDKFPGQVYFDYNEEICEMDSYQHECSDYHHYIPELNDIHPRKPKDTNTSCKICGYDEEVLP